MMDQIYTNGGDSLLELVFTAIGKILYGESGKNQTFHALLRISLTIGAFCAVCLAFSRQKFEPLIKSFFLPGLVIIGFLLVPTTDITVNEKQIKAPFFLAKFASCTSYSFHKLTCLFKDAVGKDKYPWIENICSGKNFFQHGHVSSDQILEENFQRFCHECVFRDLGMGLIDKKEFANTADLLELLRKKTSKNRSIVYQGTSMSCEKALEQMGELLSPAENKDPKFIIETEKVDQLVDSENQNLTVQKFIIDHIEEQMYGHSRQPEKTSFFALGVISLCSLRNFLEAVLYLAFPLVLLLSLLSFGVRSLIQWVRAIFWISTWPIFYVAVDLFLNSFWDFRTKGISGYTLGTAQELSNLYSSMEMIACVALVSVPFLSWILIKGSLSQIVHLASSVSVQPESKTESRQAENSFTAGEAHDLGRQTYDGHAAREVVVQQMPEENAFKSVVDSSKTEEQADSFSKSLSSIRVAVNDSSEGVLRVMKDASRLNPASPPSILKEPLPIKVEGWTVDNPRENQNMHNPSHGSWSSK